MANLREVRHRDLHLAARILLHKAAGEDRVLSPEEQSTLPTWGADHIDEVRRMRDGEDPDVFTADLYLLGDAHIAWKKAMAVEGSRHGMSAKGAQTIRNKDLREFTVELFDIAAEVTEPYKPGPRAAFNKKVVAKREHALENDGLYDKKEVGAIRKLVLAQAAQAEDRAAVDDAFVAELGKMHKLAADDKAARFIEEVSEEFQTRASYERAADALRDYLTEHAGELDKPLQSIAVESDGWEVGATMQRGVWLKVPVEPGADTSEVQHEMDALFVTEPCLQKYGVVWLGTNRA